MSIIEIESKDIYNDTFFHTLQHLKSTEAYRHFLEFSRSAGHFPLADYQNEKIEVWCSNDYLGMGQNQQVIDDFKASISRFGAGSGGSRNISGNTTAHVALEKRLADLYQRESALVFNNGYLANTESLSVLIGLFDNIKVYSDELNHRSIIEGLKKSKVEKYIFKHNDLKHLEIGLSLEPFERPKIIVFESIYSMDGDLAPVEEIVRLAKKYNALTFIDETHSFGVLGERGLGLVEALHVRDVDFIQGGFGKAIGTSGGFIVGDRDAVDCIRSLAPGFIFTTSLPPALLHATLTSINQVVASPERRNRLFQNVRHLKGALRRQNIDFIDAESHILPIIIPGLARIKAVSDQLLKQFKIYVQPINYPSVPRGQERFRVTVTPDHSIEQIERFAAALKNTLDLA
ncbi:5-aminolevulinate synthase [Rouxiella badensis]|uniref:5-aminolevulinate synthase n=1 Tax=Rouxiella badensis TaxID=1646377 RepID=UPI00178782D1|nr:5-aminolevulinate synthase [Rouxiella badensis]QOI54646.1 5-aminolevulinate synthase [Rouxiella badensis subsp. acadiensis]